MRTVNDTSAYESPQLELIEVTVEKGFVVSVCVHGWGEGENLGNNLVE